MLLLYGFGTHVEQQALSTALALSNHIVLPGPRGSLVAVGTDKTVHIGALPVTYTAGLAWDMTLSPNTHDSSSSHATG